MENNKKPPRSPQTSDKFILRLPDGMRSEIAAEAKANGRSMNAEIVARIEASKRQAQSAIPWQDLIAMLQKEATEHGAVVTITMGK